MLLNEFSEELTQQKKKGKTITGYVKDVSEFLVFLQGKNLYVGDLKEFHIKEFIVSLRQQGHASSTVSRKISSLRKYFKFLRRNRIMSWNPIEDIPNPPVSKSSEKITQEDFEEILNRITLLEETETNVKREKLLLCLMFECKLSLSEAVEIKKENYKEHQRILYTKEAFSLQEETDRVWKSCVAEVAEETEYVFVNQRGEKLSESGAFYLLKKVFHQIEMTHLKPIHFFKKN